jgi:hypothetical protein
MFLKLQIDALIESCNFFCIVSFINYYELFESKVRVDDNKNMGCKNIIFVCTYKWLGGSLLALF